jgi:hypothetical protein
MPSYDWQVSSLLHRLEMADSAANDAVRGVDMQHYRVSAQLPEDEAFFSGAGFRREVDLGLLLVLLVRLRRAVGLGASIMNGDDLSDALAEFDQRVPVARRMRNISEHIDDYIAEQGHEQEEVPIGSLGVRVWGGSADSNPTFTWAGGSIELDELRKVALDLYGAFRAALKAFAQTKDSVSPQQSQPTVNNK